MKVAIMQPYLLPYIGYFQLINAVDVFVFYDDVNFIKSGWIHRNRINNNGLATYFTVPLVKQSSFIRINKTEINQNLYDTWKQQFFKTLNVNYKDAPYYDSTIQEISLIFEHKINTISELAIVSIKHLCHYLQIKTEFKVSSENFFQSKAFGRTDRLIAITKELGGSHYINLVGGKTLYDEKYFLKHSLNLSFINGVIDVYPQIDSDFIPALSIIDILMFNSKEEVKVMINNYKLT